MLRLTQQSMSVPSRQESHSKTVYLSQQLSKSLGFHVDGASLAAPAAMVADEKSILTETFADGYHPAIVSI